jgi:hypothetical protein
LENKAKQLINLQPMIPHTYISIATGLPCPASGIWESMGILKQPLPFLKASLCRIIAVIKFDGNF